MRTPYFIILSCLVCAFLGSCSTWRQTLVSQGTITDAVENAIEDFVRTSKKLLKEDKAFSIHSDTLKGDIVLVSILGAGDRVRLANENTKPGTQDGYFPTDYKVVDGKLFYWYDPEKVITTQLLKVLKEYEHIYYQKYEYDFPEYSFDDAKKAAMYYFCMNDLRYYKKHVSSRSLPENKLPKMKCK